MSKSIAALRAEKTTRPSFRLDDVVTGHVRDYEDEALLLADEIEALDAERAKIADESSEQPRKMGAGTNPRVTEIDGRITEIQVRLSELVDILDEYKGTLTITATRSDGEWAQWRIDNPARTEGEGGHREDLTITNGWCDSDALIADLGRYVTAWNDEPIAADDFDALDLDRPRKKQIARIVIGLYETGDTRPKGLRKILSDYLSSATVSPLPSVSE